MITAFVVVVAVAVAGAPSGISTRKMTIELRQADVGNVYKLIGDVGGRAIVVDECLKDSKVDLLLKAVPAALVLDVLAAKLGVEYVDGAADAPIVVKCRPGARRATAEIEKLANPDRTAWLEAHLQLGENLAEVPSMKTSTYMRMIARSLGCSDIELDGVDEDIPRVYGSLRIRTLMEVVRDLADLSVFEVRGDVLYARTKKRPESESGQPG